MIYKIKQCEYCKQVIKCKRFCSLKCYHLWLVGKSNNSNTKFPKGNVPWNRGMKADKEWYDKMNKSGFLTPKFGKNTGNWKGGVTTDKEKFKKRTKYYRSKPGYTLKHRLHQNKRYALKKSTSDNTVTKDAIEKIMKNQSGKCNICWCDIKKCFHIDHIIPLSLDGKHTIKNIQLLCPTCNIRKSNKITIVQLKSSLINGETPEEDNPQQGESQLQRLSEKTPKGEATV